MRSRYFVFEHRGIGLSAGRSRSRTVDQRGRSTHVSGEAEREAAFGGAARLRFRSYLGGDLKRWGPENGALNRFWPSRKAHSAFVRYNTCELVHHATATCASNSVDR